MPATGLLTLNVVLSPWQKDDAPVTTGIGIVAVGQVTFIVNENSLVEHCPVLATSFTVNEPVLVGVPLNTPLLASESPSGREPETILIVAPTMLVPDPENVLV
jgi:hypothetical protein